jgi:hypothetical protein
MRRYELSLSNGFASYFGVGKTELLTMKTNILPRSPGVVLLWLSSMSPLPGNAYEHFVDTKYGKAVEVDQKRSLFTASGPLKIGPSAMCPPER